MGNALGEVVSTDCAASRQTIVDDGYVKESKRDSYRKKSSKHSHKHQSQKLRPKTAELQRPSDAVVKERTTVIRYGHDLHDGGPTTREKSTSSWTIYGGNHNIDYKSQGEQTTKTMNHHGDTNLIEFHQGVPKSKRWSFMDAFQWTHRGTYESTGNAKESKQGFHGQDDSTVTYQVARLAEDTTSKYANRKHQRQKGQAEVADLRENRRERIVEYQDKDSASGTIIIRDTTPERASRPRAHTSRTTKENRRRSKEAGETTFAREVVYEHDKCVAPPAFQQQQWEQDDIQETFKLNKSSALAMAKHESVKYRDAPTPIASQYYTSTANIPVNAYSDTSSSIGRKSREIAFTMQEKEITPLHAQKGKVHVEKEIKINHHRPARAIIEQPYLPYRFEEGNSLFTGEIINNEGQKNYSIEDAEGGMSGKGKDISKLRASSHHKRVKGPTERIEQTGYSKTRAFDRWSGNLESRGGKVISGGSKTYAREESRSGRSGGAALHHAHSAEYREPAGGLFEGMSSTIRPSGKRGKNYDMDGGRSGDGKRIEDNKGMRGQWIEGGGGSKGSSKINNEGQKNYSIEDAEGGKSGRGKTISTLHKEKRWDVNSGGAYEHKRQTSQTLQSVRDSHLKAQGLTRANEWHSPDYSSSKSWWGGKTSSISNQQGRSYIPENDFVYNLRT